MAEAPFTAAAVDQMRERGELRPDAGAVEKEGALLRALPSLDLPDHQLPEVFAGFPRAETPFPIPYPTSCKPQAWAAGAPVLLLQILLGLGPDRGT